MKIAIIIAIILIVVGIVICAVSLFSAGFDFKKLSTQKLVTETHTVSEDFTNILIKTNVADVTLVLSEDGECKIDSNLSEKFKVFTTVEDGTLSIAVKDMRKWYEHISMNFFGFEDEVITVYLPRAELGSLGISTNTGDVHAPSNLSFSSVNVKANTADVSIYSQVTGDVQILTDTGDIKLEGTNPQNVTLKVDTGDIKAGLIAAQGSINISSDTGDIKLYDTRAKELKIKSNTGDTQLNNVMLTDTVNIKTNTGDVEFSGFDASGIKIVTNTGDVRGSLLTPKLFVVKSDTGREIYPTDSFSEQRCEINSNTGDIKVSIE